MNGFPIFRKNDDDSFMSNATCSFIEVGETVTLQIEETYNKINGAGTVDESVFLITRYFTFNKNTNRFEETKQEVIYTAK
jgi:hypothetical protein